MKLPKKTPSNTICELGASVQKKKLWDACKRKVDKSHLIEGAFVFAKQGGYAPWPSKILVLNKSSSIVKYYGYVDSKGNVKNSEIVQVNTDSMEEIGALVEYTLKTKSIKDFERFNKAIKEDK